MKYNFPTEHVVKGMPVTLEAFVGLMVVALPIVFIGFTTYYIATRNQRKEKNLARKEWIKKYGSPALRKKDSASERNERS